MSEATGVFLADDLAVVRGHALVLVDSAEAAQEETEQEKTAQEMEA